jgi:hypothetical protein
MPQDSLIALFENRLGHLPARERRSLASIVSECINAYGKVRDIHRKYGGKQCSTEESQRLWKKWYPTKMNVQELWETIRQKVVTIPTSYADDFAIVIGCSPTCLPSGYTGPSDPIINAVGTAARGPQAFLEKLLNFLQQRTRPGDPGRPSYPDEIVAYVRKLREKSPRSTAWKDVYAKCKRKYPRQVSHVELLSFKRSMQRRLKAGG